MRHRSCSGSAREVDGLAPKVHRVVKDVGICPMWGMGTGSTRPISGGK